MFTYSIFDSAAASSSP